MTPRHGHLLRSGGPIPYSAVIGVERVDGARDSLASAMCQ
jgi:hypothetical protein